MSTNPVLVPVSLVSQFLANEKMASRHWLQCQMECLLDQVFDQLSTKFEDYLGSNAITGTAHHTTIDTDHIQHEQIREHQYEPTFRMHFQPQLQTTTDHLTNTELWVPVEQSQNEGFRGNDIEMDSNGQANPNGIDTQAAVSGQTTYDQTHNHPLLSFTTSNLELSNQTDEEEKYGLGVDNQSLDDDIEDNAARIDGDEPEVKVEFDDTVNQQITTNQVSQSSSSLSAPHSNGLSNHLTNGDDEDDCVCDECQNVIEVKEEDGDDDDVQIIDDNDGQTLPRKKQRMDTTHPNSRQSQIEPTEERDADDEPSQLKKIPRICSTESYNRQSLVARQSSSLESINQSNQTQPVNGQTGPTEEAEETNNQDKQIIALGVHCLETDCPLMFDNKTELNLHISTKHNILLYRCIVKDCKQSFSTQNNLSEHLKQVHPNTTRWHCGKCPNHYPTYLQLGIHNYQYHQLGQYKCSFSNCTFTGEHRQKVFNHYKHQHKTAEFTCNHLDCGRRFKKKSGLKRHQQAAHLGIRPYQCKWPSCGYAATQASNAITHIKNKHLNLGSIEQPPVDPREYLEVLPDLL